MASIEDKNLIIECNLQENDRALANALEKRAAHIGEKAVLAFGSEEEEQRDVYDRIFARPKREKLCIPQNERYISAVQRAVDTYDRIGCVDNFYKKSRGLLNEEVAEAVFDTNTVVYLKNPLADIAYNAFSAHISDPRVSYEETFSDVCEEVYYNRAPYCILPIENSEDGRLTGFGNMIRKYELKITLTCNVESANGRITRFALLKRDVGAIKCSKSATEGEFLEIGLNFGEEKRLYEVMQAADYFGYKLNKVDSLPIYYSEREYYFDIVFEGKGDLDRFLFWLELEVPRYEIIGLYTQVKVNRAGKGIN